MEACRSIFIFTHTKRWRKKKVLATLDTPNSDLLNPLPTTRGLISLQLSLHFLPGACLSLHCTGSAERPAGKNGDICV